MQQEVLEKGLRKYLFSFLASETENNVSSSKISCLFLLHDWVQVEGAAVQAG